MIYNFIFLFIFAFLCGAGSVLLMYRKKIFRDAIYLFPFETEEQTDTELCKKIYSFLSSNADLSIFSKTIDAIEHERQRISTDMHDEMSGYLASIYIDLQIVYREQTALSGHASKLLFDSSLKIKDVVKILRKIIHGIQPTVLETSNLEGAIRHVCKMYEKVKGTRVSFFTSGEPLQLSDKEKTNLYRITQELLNNCSKHSFAWDIHVSILWGDNELKLIVKDSGVGMPTMIKGMDKYGVSGILARALDVGATVKFKAQIIGTEFELRLSPSSVLKHPVLT